MSYELRELVDQLELDFGVMSLPSGEIESLKALAIHYRDLYREAKRELEEVHNGRP